LALTFATAKALWFGFLLLPKAKAAKSRTKGTLSLIILKKKKKSI
jgi:hypothetical protein